MLRDGAAHDFMKISFLWMKVNHKVSPHASCVPPFFFIE